MRHRKAVVCCLLMLMAAALFADNWVLAAEAFTGDETIGTLMPSLILDAIPTSLVRIISDEEHVFRKLLSLEGEVSSEKNELDKLIRERDTVIFTTADESARRREIAGYEDKIAGLRAVLQEKQDEIAVLEAYDFSAPAADMPFEETQENVVLWNSNSSSLYARAEDKDPADINALITGSIQVRNGFLYVKAGLLVYPGTIVCNETVVAGPLSDTALLAEEIASSLVDTIVNTTPVSLSFTISPSAVRKSAEVSVDGMNVQNPESLHAFQSGIHTITVEAPGYAKQTFTRDFSESPRYRIDVQLPHLNPVNLEVTASGASSGNEQVWIAGKSAGLLPAKVMVNGQQVLGLVQDESGITTYFALDTAGRDMTAALKLRKESSQSRIEKARKSLYTSYGLLLISLPFSFYFYGRMEDAFNAYTNGLPAMSTADEFYKWQKLERISVCVSIGLGVNMIYRMVKYMLAADSVLPEQIEQDKDER